ncbi:esterase/lipase family protein [Amycolatopsis rifamycinica]|uniref:Esterase n=1 Tax=Amycolatopsis rifamycinica TaxID=287986 RepID=A0A066TRX9_9PSEU|nr:alpha/beta fold hydrolase [Amycolatopsis rifamycinica]KDN17941.1 esterase [Amycolatopsis rifamycinica]
MTTFVLVHGAWHGPWAWDRIVPLLHAAGARTLTPELSVSGGLHDHAETVITALDAVRDDDVVLVGHSYAGLVVREAADARADAVGHVVLVDGWAGPDGSSLFGLAPETTVRALLAAAGDGPSIPAPPPAAYGVTDPGDVAWLAPRLVPQSRRSFTETTRLSGAVDRIPGTALWCRPKTYAFEELGQSVGYRTRALDAPHDVMVTHPASLARLLLQDAEARSLE